MRITKQSRMCWVVPALAAVMTGTGVNIISAAPADGAKPKIAKSSKPKSRTMEGALVSANATTVQLKAKDGEKNVALVPATEYWRIQTSLSATDLQVGDIVKFTLKGTDDMATVQSLAPLTLKFADIATLTLDKTGRTKFDRVSKITANELTAGQEVKVASSLFPDGKFEAREVWVIVAPAKAVKKSTTANKD